MRPLQITTPGTTGRRMQTNSERALWTQKMEEEDARFTGGEHRTCATAPVWPWSPRTSHFHSHLPPPITSAPAGDQSNPPPVQQLATAIFHGFQHDAHWTGTARATHLLFSLFQTGLELSMLLSCLPFLDPTLWVNRHLPKIP